MKHKVGKPHNISLSDYDFNAASLQSLYSAVRYQDPSIQLNLVQKVSNVKYFVSIV